MKTLTLTKYQAHDGALFDTQSMCMTHERELAECAVILALLVSPPKDCVGFSNGEGYIQHDPDSLKKAVAAFTDRLLVRFNEQLSRAAAANDDYRIKELTGLLVALTRAHDAPTPEVMHRLRYYQDRCGMWNGPYADVLFRFNCIDFEKAREFDQPYYVTHQHEVTGGAVNP